MRGVRAVIAVGLMLAVAVATGCGSGSGSAAGLNSPGHAQAGSAPGSGPVARRDGDADAASKQVIRSWSESLARSDVAAAARYFALPSTVQLAPTTPPVVLHLYREARGFNLLLPCSARFLRADRQGRYVNALFRLGNRPGSSCDGLGGTARVAFVIADGKIAEWRRAPDQPQDQRYARPAPGVTPPGGVPPTPSAPAPQPAPDAPLTPAAPSV